MCIVYDVTMLRTQVMLTPSQKTMIDFYAETQGLSLSEVVRQAIERFFSQPNLQKNTAKMLIERAKHAPTGAPKDLSTNDDYIYSV